MPSLRVTELNIQQLLKAESPILLTPPGIVMDSRLVQDLKALLPIWTILSGRVIAVMFDESSKAESPMDLGT